MPVSSLITLLISHCYSVFLPRDIFPESQARLFPLYYIVCELRKLGAYAPTDGNLRLPMSIRRSSMFTVTYSHVTQTGKRIGITKFAFEKLFCPPAGPELK